VRLLLLGASGFLGRHVRDAAAVEADTVVVAHAGSRRRPLPGDWVTLDLLEATSDELRDLLLATRPTVVVNCAGALGADAAQLAALNVDLVGRVLAAVRGATPDARFVQLGSAAEYGRVPRGRTITEDVAARPVGEYGRTKLAATRLVLAAREARADAVVLRAFNPIGAGMPPATLPGRAAHLLAQAMDAGLPSIELGPLEAWRDFVDARDVAAAVLAAARARGPLPPVVNVGSGTAVQARTMVHELAAIAGFSGEVIEAGQASPRSIDVPWQRASIDLARRALGWRPRHALHEALERLWSGATATDGA
jgi:nucleoside-diphosphate-sugar epimerase